MQTRRGNGQDVSKLAKVGETNICMSPHNNDVD